MQNRLKEMLMFFEESGADKNWAYFHSIEFQKLMLSINVINKKNSPNIIWLKNTAIN